jgi:hypothetical protein
MLTCGPEFWCDGQERAALEHRGTPPREPMPSIRNRLRQVTHLDRRCHIHATPIGPLGLGDLCESCLTRRRNHGHPKVRKGLSSRDWRPILPAVLKHVKANPASPEVLGAVERLLDPGSQPAPSVPARHPSRLLYEELARWSRPESRKVHRRWNFSPRGVLCRLLAAKVVIEEQECRWPGDAPEIELTRVLALMFRRPKQASGKHGTRMAGGARRELARRLKASGALGVYLLQASRAIIRLRQQEQDEINRRPKKPQPPPPTIYTPTAPPRTAGGWPASTEITR